MSSLSLQASGAPLFSKSNDPIKPAELRDSRLPNDCLSLVLAYAGDPLVYQGFPNDIVKKAYISIWKSYSEHPLLASRFSIGSTLLERSQKHVMTIYNLTMNFARGKNILPTIHRLMDRGMAPLAAAPILEIAQFAEDESLLMVFSKIVEKIKGLQPEAADFFKEIVELPFDKQACRIRQWMHNNSELLGTITSINLSKLYLSTVPEEVTSYLTGLRDLNLTHNKLVAIPKAIDNLALLRRVFFFHNQLTELPDTISNLAQLTMLAAPNNKLVRIPASIGNLALLEEIYLFKNELTALPPSIGRLTNLRVLAVSYNQLTQIPDTIGDIDNLTDLSLSRNQLTSIPQRLTLLALEKLNLYGNPLKADVLPIIQELRNEGCEVVGASHLEAEDDDI